MVPLWDQKIPTAKSPLTLPGQSLVSDTTWTEMQAVAVSPFLQSSCVAFVRLLDSTSWFLCGLWVILCKAEQIWALALAVNSGFELVSSSVNSSDTSHDSTMTLQAVSALCTLSDQYGLPVSLFLFLKILPEGEPYKCQFSTREQSWIWSNPVTYFPGCHQNVNY